jgi:hypothetical protein
MAKLCKAGIQLREQVDDAFPDRDRTSDGWIGDKRHSARKSDHNPTAEGIVRALDIDVNFRSHKAEPYDYLPDLIKESLISSSTAKLPAINAITNGESTPG